MKALLFLSVLFLSAGTAKAEETSTKAAYYYGSIYGTGSTLCSLVNDGKLDKDYSRDYLAGMVELLRNDPKSSDVSSSIDRSYKDIKNEPECKEAI